MTAYTFFDFHVVTVHSFLGEAGLWLACAAVVALCTLLRAPLRRIPHEEARLSVRNNGILLGATVAILGAVGLRAGSQAWPNEETTGAVLFHWLTGGTMVAAAASVVALAVSRLMARGLVSAMVTQPSASVDNVEAALQSLQDLRDVMARLEETHREAQGRALQEGEPSVKAEYAATAAVIEKKVLLGRELERAVAAAVLRLACRAPLRALLESRPDDIISRLGSSTEKAPVLERVLAARSSVDGFLERADDVRNRLQNELARGPGSVAERVGLDADAAVGTARDAVEEIHGSYTRVRHRLEALRLRLEAEADSNRVLQAALSVAPGDARAAPDAASLASEISQTDEASRRALAAATDNPENVMLAVARASTAFQQDDHERLADLLAAMRELTDGPPSGQG